MPLGIGIYFLYAKLLPVPVPARVLPFSPNIVSSDISPK